MKISLPILCALAFVTVAITITKLAVSAEQKFGTETHNVNERLGEGLSAEQAAAFDAAVAPQTEANQIVLPDGQLLSDFIAENKDWFSSLDKEKNKNKHSR